MKKTLLVAVGVLALCVWAVPCYADAPCGCGAPVASCGCDTGCHGGGFLSKCKGMFHHSSSSCCTTECAPPPCDCAPACGCASTGHKWFGGCHSHGCNASPCGCNAPAPAPCDTCNSCGCGSGHKLFGGFHHSGCGCGN
ncbi:MAG TPA: hypothetical protein VG013_40840 [Gemmataceae bacterium]|jgi:hypothetical protein|nr:hypothetical protein [Gemmataceae bacterium]